MFNRFLFVLVLAALLLSACGSNDMIVSGAAQPENPQSVESTGKFVIGSSYSGDDLYDPAANPALRNELGANPLSQDSNRSLTGHSYSGDDPYDPAAGGLCSCEIR
ncbi:MAG: hypothetical protein P8074_26800 [Anaerolineales bacterium]|jgi:hypothetical protein